MSVYLFHSSFFLSNPATGIQYDEALRLSKVGHTIYFIYCNGMMSQCFNNIRGESALCYICKSKYKKEKKRFSEFINFVEIPELLNESNIHNIKSYNLDYKNIEDIKKLEYRNINIGLGALSGYISKSRNLSPLIDDEFRHFFDENLHNAMINVEAVSKAIEIFKPDHIVLYNGRFADSRPIWQLALKYNIPYTTLEAAHGINNNYKAVYENATAHSIDKNTELINYFWDNSELDIETRKSIGSSFFVKRKNAEYSGDKVYAKNQIKNLLPDSWDSSKKNIVIFNSSEDEFAALGGEYDEYKLFNSQLEGLQFIKDFLKNNKEINVTLRVHPNLMGVPYSYATNLIKLKSDNFDVIEANSQISSYALVDNADIVVVFNSTIGIESVYWDKPTILLSGALYYKLDCCYIPDSKKNLEELLLSNLKPKDKFNTFKFGYYLINEEREGPSAYNYNWSNKQIKFFNKKKNIIVFENKKLFNSRRLYTLFHILQYKIVKKYYSFKKNKGVLFNLPTKENSDNLIG
jgi:hypothetical protein